MSTFVSSSSSASHLCVTPPKDFMFSSDRSLLGTLSLL